MAYSANTWDESTRVQDLLKLEKKVKRYSAEGKRMRGATED